MCSIKKLSFVLMVVVFMFISSSNSEAVTLRSFWSSGSVAVSSETKVILLAFVGTSTVLFSGYFFWSQFPHILLWRAHRTIFRVEQSVEMRLVMEQADDEKMFFEQVDALYITHPYARMVAMDCFTNMLSDIQKAICFLYKVQHVWINSSRSTEVKNLLNEARLLERCLMSAVAIIKRMPNYCEQRKAHEEKVAAERLRREIRFAAHQVSLNKDRPIQIIS